MNIKWNEVTWYSRLLAILLFLFVVPYLTFYIGREYQKTFEVNADILSNYSIPANSMFESTSSVNEFKTGSSTVDGITFEFKIPREFTEQKGDNVIWASQETLDLGHGEKLNFSVLNDVSSKNDLIKKETALKSYIGEPGYGNFSEMSSGTWNIVKGEPFGGIGYFWQIV